MAEAISLAKELNDMYGLAVALFAAALADMERDLADVERHSSDLIELSTRHHYAQWLAVGSILRGWARSASGETFDGISWIEDGIDDWRATTSMFVQSLQKFFKSAKVLQVGKSSSSRSRPNDPATRILWRKGS
jgi:hypothetical protein